MDKNEHKHVHIWCSPWLGVVGECRFGGVGSGWGLYVMVIYHPCPQAGGAAGRGGGGVFGVGDPDHF